MAKDKQLVVRVTPEQHEWLQEEARRDDRSVAYVVRRVLRQQLRLG